MLLSELKQGEKAIISKIKGRGAFRKRILEMGFIAGREIEFIKKAPLNDPFEYRIMGYDLSLRRSESELIEIDKLNGSEIILESNFNGVLTENSLKVEVATGPWNVTNPVCE